VLVIALGIAGFTWVNTRIVDSGQGGIDFYPMWSAAHAWAAKGTSPYSDTVAQQIYRDVQGREPVPVSKAGQYAFLSPLYSMVFMAPVGVLGLTTARIVWMTLSEICLVLVAFFSLRLSGWKISSVGTGFLLVFTLVGYYGARTVIQGPFSAIAAALILGGLLLIQSGRDMDAGLLLALATVDLHMSALLVLFAFFWSLSVRRSRIALGIFIGVAFLTVCAMVFLPDWPVQWAKSMFLNLPVIFARGSAITTLANRLPGIVQPLSLVLYAVAVIYLIAEWILAWGHAERWFQWTALLTLLISLVLPLRVDSTDTIVLLPAACLLFRSWQERWGINGQRTAWILIGLSLAGFWGLYVGTLQGTKESPLMLVLPPLIYLATLWWARWWAIHRQRLFFEEFPV
jgi:hypothetical protein